MNRIKNYGLSAGILGALFSAGCGDDASTPGASATQTPLNLTIVSLFAPSPNLVVAGAPLDFPYQQAVIAFERNLEATGRFEVEVVWMEEVVARFPGATPDFPGSAAAVFNALKAGTDVQVIHTLPRLIAHGTPDAQDVRDSFKDIFENVPFGPNREEFQAWLQFGGGQVLYDRFYETDGVLPFPGGNSGAQMGGWFRDEINDVSQFSGLAIRIAGFANEVLTSLGAMATSQPVGLVNGLIMDGTLQAAELCCPITDRSFGVAQTAHGMGWIYHYPGWHEPHANAQYLFNETAVTDAGARLDIRNAMAQAAAETDLFFENKNREALIAIQEMDVQFHQFPDTLLDALRTATESTIYTRLRGIPEAAPILDSMLTFTGGADATSYGSLTEGTYYDTRPLPP